MTCKCYWSVIMQDKGRPRIPPVRQGPVHSLNPAVVKTWSEEVSRDESRYRRSAERQLTIHHTQLNVLPVPDHRCHHHQSTWRQRQTCAAEAARATTPAHDTATWSRAPGRHQGQTRRPAETRGISADGRTALASAIAADSHSSTFTRRIMFTKFTNNNNNNNINNNSNNNQKHVLTTSACSRIRILRFFFQNLKTRFFTFS